MEIKVKALCVRSVDYRDNDSLITLASLERGKITAVVRGSKKQTSKLRFSASLFCFAEYILTVSKSGRYTVTGCDLIDGFYALREDVEKFYVASISAEILEKNLYLPNDKLILTTLKTLKSLCYNEKEMVSAIIEYTYKAMLCLGYSLPKIECKVCGLKRDLYFDKTTLDFVCKAHKENKGIGLTSKEVGLFTEVYFDRTENFENFDNATRQNVLYILIKYFESISEQTYKTYKSYFDLLKEIY